MKRIFLLPLVVVFICSGTVYAAEPIRIGVITPLTGSVSFVGNESLKGATLAAEQINEAGGLLGRPIKIYAGDNKCLPAEAVSATRRLISRDEVIAIIGHVCSSATLAAMPINQSEGVPLMVDASTNPKITLNAGVGGNEWVFRANLPDDINALVFAKMIVELGGPKVSILATNDDWGRGVAESFSKVIEQEGGEVLSTDFYEEGETDFLSTLTKIKGLNPDAMLVASRMITGSVIMKQYGELGMKIPVFNQGDMVNADFIKLVGAEIAEGLMGSESWYPGADDAMNQKFIEEYEERLGMEPIESSAYGYTAMQLIAQAIRNTGKATREGVRDGLKMIDMDTMVGHVKFDEHNQAWTQVVIAKITNGKIQVVKRVNVSRPEGYWEKAMQK